MISGTTIQKKDNSRRWIHISAYCGPSGPQSRTVWGIDNHFRHELYQNSDINYKTSEEKKNHPAPYADRSTSQANRPPVQKQTNLKVPKSVKWILVSTWSIWRHDRTVRIILYLASNDTFNASIAIDITVTTDRCDPVVDLARADRPN